MNARSLSSSWQRSSEPSYNYTPKTRRGVWNSSEMGPRGGKSDRYGKITKTVSVELCHRAAMCIANKLLHTRILYGWIGVGVFLANGIHCFQGSVLHVALKPKTITNGAGNTESVLVETTIEFVIGGECSSITTFRGGSAIRLTLIYSSAAVRSHFISSFSFKRASRFRNLSDLHFNSSPI